MKVVYPETQKNQDLEGNQELLPARSILESYTGKLVIEFLKVNKNGATVSEIVNHLQQNHGTDSEKISEAVEYMLENATVMGFLERPNGTKSVNWIPRNEYCRSTGRVCKPRHTCGHRRSSHHRRSCKKRRQRK